MCPVNWSAGEGEGIDSRAEDVDRVGGMGVGKLRSGVAISSVVAGDEKEEGVEACSVANRSGVGVETGLKSLHPSIKTSRITIHRNLVLFIIRLDRFKIEFLPCEYFRAHTPATGTKDFPILRMIFLEAGHALHFSSDPTKMKLRAFGECTFAQLFPIFLNRVMIEFRNLTYE